MLRMWRKDNSYNVIENNAGTTTLKSKRATSSKAEDVHCDSAIPHLGCNLGSLVHARSARARGLIIAWFTLNVSLGGWINKCGIFI